MSDYPFQFGQSLGSLRDPETGVVVSPRILGEARLHVQDPAVFSAQSAALGGEAALLAFARTSIGKHFSQEAVAAVTTGTSMKALGQHLQGLTAATTAKVDAELRPYGAVLQIGSWNLSFSDDDVARLKAAAQAHKLASGAHVLATWTDGKTYPGTVRGFNGTHYEIAWDGGTSSGWIPAAMLKIG